MIHILSIGGVVLRKARLKTYGYGKHHAWCDNCNCLKPKTDFYLLWIVPHPDSSTGLYYEGHHSHWCKECAAKAKPMPKREYERRLRKTLNEASEAFGDAKPKRGTE